MKFLYYFLVVNLLFIPNLSLASTNDFLCSANGYTIATINGVFTNDNDAKKNKEALEFKLGKEYNGEQLIVDYLLNPPHLGGLGDIAVATYQKIFDEGKVEDYDFVEILKSASEKVRTQKLLLVAHSQGNFYANSFYDAVAGQIGGVPKESIGVYGVATPAGRVAGDGKWLTSNTDKIISDLVARTPGKNIMAPNTHIELQSGDDPLGHKFSDVYLKYKGGRIVSDIQASLERLSKNNIQGENELCIDPPKLTLAHKTIGVVLAVADPIAGVSSRAVVGTAAAVHKANQLVMQVGEQVILAMNNVGNFVKVDTIKDFFHTLVFGNAGQYENLKLVAQISLSNKDSDSVEAVGEKKSEQAERREEVNNGNNPVNTSNRADILINEEDEDAKEQAAK